MRTKHLTNADFDAAAAICFAVKQRLITRMDRFEELAEQATGQKKKRLQNLAALTSKRALSYLREGLRASEGNVTACERAFTDHVKILKNFDKNDA